MFVELFDIGWIGHMQAGTSGKLSLSEKFKVNRNRCINAADSCCRACCGA